MEDNVYQNLDILLFINSLNLTRKLTVFAASYEGKFVLTLVVLLKAILWSPRISQLLKQLCKYYTVTIHFDRLVKCSWFLKT